MTGNLTTPDRWLVIFAKVITVLLEFVTRGPKFA
jgi:hypothetical protein